MVRSASRSVLTDAEKLGARAITVIDGGGSA